MDENTLEEEQKLTKEYLEWRLDEEVENYWKSREGKGLVGESM